MERQGGAKSTTKIVSWRSAVLRVLFNQCTCVKSDRITTSTNLVRKEH